MTTAGSKRRKGKDGMAVMGPRARLTRVRRGKTTKKKASSGPPGEAAAARQPVYLVVEHGVEEPTHSILEVAAAGPALRPPAAVIDRPGAAPRPLRYGRCDTSFAAVRTRYGPRSAAPRPLRYGRCDIFFAAVRTRYGPRIVGLGQDRNLIYNPETSKEVQGPPLLDRLAHPVLIPHGSELFALSRSPSVFLGADFMPWFFIFDLDKDAGWRSLPPPPVFPCRLNPLEYRDPPEVRVAAYAVVGSHILLSVQQDKGTCAFDVDARKWEMEDDRNLPFVGQAVSLGGHRFVACSRARGGTAAVYRIEVVPAGTTEPTGRAELSVSIIELPVKSKGIVPGQLLCAMGTGRFSSLDIRSADPGPDAN
ncbi:hypothetical protein PVAP13_2KG203090 [Panicum virgatum]|uniref:Uncharacterized protein n=1 Tax=Panicum virgatum TaxID=38727 RepID=A0A8T0W9L0_PANVG|nr:hypothetical protein PVAP13_2KG203090 [Panicum virgatum]